MLNVALLVSYSVRWTQVGKLIKEILVRPNVIFGDLPVGEDREEEVRDVVAQRAAIIRKRRGACGVVSQ